MKKLPKKYDIRNAIYNYSSGETTIRLTIPQKDIEKSLKETQYSKHKWGSIDIKLIYKNGRPNFAYIPQESVLDKIRAEVERTAKEYDTFDDYRRTRGLWIALEIIDKYRKESEALEQKPQWIPVSEKLPEVGVTVLGITAFDDIYVADLYDVCGNKEWYANGCYDVPIVAWMPLPEPYKESEE